jgi:hypothetical protein
VILSDKEVATMVSGLWIHPKKLRYLPQERKRYTDGSKDFEVDTEQMTPDSPSEVKIPIPQFAIPKS